MAAVAAEPGAAAASTTEEELEFALESADHERNLNADVTRGSAPVMDLCHQHRDVDAVQECSPVQMEIVGRPDIEAAGKTLSAHGGDEHDKMCYLNREGDNIADNNFEDYKMNDNVMSTGFKEQCSLNLEAVNEVSPHDTHACLLPSSISVSVSQPSVVFLHSLPAHPSVTETGLSLAEPAEPAIVGRNLGSIDDFRELIKPSSETDPVPESACDGPGSEFMPREDALLECPQHADHPQSLSVSESDSNLGASVDDGFASDFSAVPAEHSPQLPVVGDTVLSSPLPVDSCSPQRRFDSHLCEVKPEPKPSLPISESTGSPLELLIPGSEVRVCLDHIIDDALVVSFRLGEKLFSGVLMDLSKRFGPYGIPITLHPKREYKDKPEPMQLKAVPPTADAEKTHGKNTNDNSQKEPPPPTEEGRNGTLESTPTPTPPEANPNPNRPPHPWTSKPPPLFQEGAPYPPPLFIRDTYNQPLPQPPPRKIKRPKRRLLYREEPTSIMNAIKLRPRQVLCDKCKGTVTVGGGGGGGGSGGGDSRRETRRGGPAASDCRNDDGKRRRNDHSANTVSGKRHRPDEKARGGADSGKRQSSAHLRISSSTTSSSLGSVKGAAAGGNRVVRGVSSSAGNGNSRVSSNQLSKKVLQSKNVDHVAKAQEKMAKVPCRQRDTVTSSGVNNTNSNNNNNNNSGGGAKTMTRSAALQQAHQHQKVHFTRRLQQISTRGVGGGVGVGSSGVGGPPSISSPLPPRMRLKPQRYRNEENESSPPSSSKPSPPPPPPLPPPPPCLEKVPATSVVHVSLAKVAAAAPPPHCTSSSRSSSSASSTTSSSCSPPSSGSACEPAAVVAATVAAPASVAAPAFTATAAATVFETLGPAKVAGPEPDPRPPVLPEPQTQPILTPHPQPQPEPELVPVPEPEPATVTATAAERGDSTVEAEEQEGREERLEMRGSGNKAAAAASGGGNLLVYVSLKPSQPDSSSTSMCSVDSSDEAKSSNSECSSTETFDFPPPGALSSPVPVVPAIPVVPSPSTSSSSSSTVATSATTTADAVIAPDTSSPVIDGDENRRGKSHKGSTFSKNVSKCMTLDGRTICVGDIVWAKIYGFPWWPARIQAIQVSRKDNGLLVRQEARVAWFGSPTTSCLGLTQLAPFLENFQSRFNKKRKGLYRKAITEAAKAAKQLTPEVRALLTQFET